MAVLFSRGGWMLVIALGLAIVDWVAITRRHKRLEYVFKPATLVAVYIAGWLFTRDAHNARLAQFFLGGFFFSLEGDILLMLPVERFFLPGLIAFFVAHGFYIVGLNPTLPSPFSLLILAILVPLGLWFYRRLAAALRDSGQNDMRVPVALYSTMLAAMWFSAWATLFRPGWSAGARLVVIVGATLFLASDAMLGWRRFVRPSRTLDVLVIITYHLAQMALALTIALAV